MTEIELPVYLETLGSYAFASCEFKSIIIPADLESAGSSLATSGIEDVTISEGMEKIPEGLFNNMTSLKTVTIPSSVTAIDDRTFSYKYTLESIQLSEGLTSIGAQAFLRCDHLADVIIPESVTEIGDSAFAYCKKLASIFIPKNVISLGTAPFVGCTFLSSIEVDSNNTVYDSRDNCNAVIETASNTLLFGCFESTIPDSVSIGDNAFAGSDILSVTIPEGVTGIGDNAFGNCFNIKNVIIPSTVASIGSHAFINCAYLENVIISEGTINIGDFAFAACRELESITIPNSVKNIGEGAFNYCSTLKDVYFIGTEEEWQAIVISSNGNSDLVNANIHYQPFVPVSITEQPENVTAPAGDTVYFSVTAEGSDLTYQWQFRKNSNISWGNTSMAGADTDTITVPVTAARNGYQYRCIVTDSRGNSITSEIATLTVGKELKITKQPEDVAAAVGENACFSVTAEGEGLTYQWQFRKNSNISWGNTSMTGAQTDTITVPVTAARNGYQYRCKITDGSGNTVTSEIAILTVGIELKITKQPENVTASAGDTVYFSVTAEGSDLTYQWQFRKNSNVSWGNTSMAGARTDTITVPVTAARNGYQYRCKITDGSGNTVTSEIAILTVGKELNITKQPENVTASAGDTVYFSVTAEGDGLTYQWQFRKNSNISWGNTSMTGAQTDTITVPVTAARNGYQYRCKITDGSGNTVTSEIAILTVGIELKITKQPENVTASAGDTVYFSVTAEGSDLTYQWQFRKNSNVSWGNTSMAGARTDTITVPVTAARNGYQYRCKITDGSGNTVTSEIAILTVGIELKITKQPEDVTASAGDTVYFSVTAEGEGLTYQWQFRKNSNISWGNTSMTGAQTDTITVPVTAARNGYQYRCKITDGSGNTVTSEIAILTVGIELKITKQPENVTASAGDTVYFSVTAEGEGLTYQWQFRKNSNISWGNTSMAGAKTDTITVPVTTARNGYQYRCIVTDSNDDTVTSETAILTVK